MGRAADRGKKKRKCVVSSPFERERWAEWRYVSSSSNALRAGRGGAAAAAGNASAFVASCLSPLRAVRAAASRPTHGFTPILSFTSPAWVGRLVDAHCILIFLNKKFAFHVLRRVIILLHSFQ